MLWTIAIVLLHVGLVTSSTNYSDCPNKLSVLERSLYEFADNELKLNRAFFPPRQPSSRYINVTYTFEKSEPSDPDCAVSYTWSVGGFLLIQPPSLFKFSSLLFSVPVNDLQSIELILPHECRPLVLNSSGNCSCHNSNNTKDSTDREVSLDILTQQVSFFFMNIGTLHILNALCCLTYE